MKEKCKKEPVKDVEKSTDISKKECNKKPVDKKSREKMEKCPLCSKRYHTMQLVEKHISMCVKKIAWKKQFKIKKQ